jgi:hypothetical protein
VGFDRLDLKALQTVRTLPAEQQSDWSPRAMEFTVTSIPEDWELARLWPNLQKLPLRSAHVTWPQLRSERGLLAELAAALHAEQRVLVICPQAWMIERLWPVLVPLAHHVSRFRPDAGPGTAGQILRLLTAGPHTVIGGPGTWKLVAYHAFDRILLLDPTHPQYSPERTPHLDPRLALLLSAANHEAARVDFVHLGFDAISGIGRNIELAFHEPAEPPIRPGARPALTEQSDVDPLPLELRRPDLRRLVYFNRLGSGRGLYCAECWSAVACPQCGSARIHYSPRRHAYVCPDCTAEERELRCPGCHLIALVSVLPGLESVTRRPGDLVLQGPQLDIPPPTQWHSVIGTAHLLDPVPGYWPQQITYVHADGRVGLSADWPGAIDMALRLAALYDNPELASVHIVSARLVEQFGETATPQEIQQRFDGERELSGLAGLPPYGTLYHLRGIAARQGALEDGRRLLGENLHELPGTTLLRLGTSFRQGGVFRFGGWLINPDLALRELQELSWKLHRAEVTLAIHPLRGPWI